MEIASPIEYKNLKTGSKRKCTYSPILSKAFDYSSVRRSSANDLSMISTGIGQTFKRKRNNVLVKYDDINLDLSSDSKNYTIFSPILGNSLVNKSLPFICKKDEKMKYGYTYRFDNSQNIPRRESSLSHRHLQILINKQASQIEQLKSDKIDSVELYNRLKISHDKTFKENMLLKRAVAIQQERQNQTATDLETVCHHKIDNEKRARQLEKIITTLRYRLQSNQILVEDKNLGLNYRPPDVI